MIFTMIKNSLFRAKAQKFLAFITVGLSVALIACMLNMTLKIGDEVAKELRGYGSNIVVLPKSNALSVEIGGKEYSPLKNEDYLKEADLHHIKEIFWRNNIVAFAPFLDGKVKSGDKIYSIQGTYFDKNVPISDENDYKTGVTQLNIFWHVDGEYPKDDSLTSVIVGDRLAQKDGIKVGDKLNLANHEVSVTGILHGADTQKNQVVMSLKLAQILLDKPGLINKAEVSAMTIPENDLSVRARRNLDSLDSVEYDKWYCSAYVSSIAYQISEEFPSSLAKGVLSVSQTQSGITQKIQSLMGIVSIIALLISSIGITSLMSSEIYRRTKEIGLLKAIGASNFSIYLNFCLEMVIVGVIASLFGVILGYALSFALFYQIFDSFVGFSFMVLPLCVAFGVLICILGSILPLKSVIDILPAKALYGRK
ncbi:ABC transporter permease [Campylobacter geochelonis]|uniref:ABC transporter permease n=1 Tax=Campylobacter geochelonis TaxID=1780362 RepID=UPI000770ABE0|nr:FtsX-like permease family protein [Campylobacter geochelonis]CZE49982.1 ABC transport permease [Campylobacter geochelonis]